MNLQALVVFGATGAAALFLLRGPLRALFGSDDCASGAGCAGCSAACPSRKQATSPLPVPARKVSPGRLP